MKHGITALLIHFACGLVAILLLDLVAWVMLGPPWVWRYDYCVAIIGSMAAEIYRVNKYTEATP